MPHFRYTTYRSNHLLLAILVFAAILFAHTVRAQDLSFPPQLFGGLPLEMAIKEVRGSGRLTFASFDDPTCTYCRRLFAEVADMSDVTIYTFVYPVLSAESMEIAKILWCAKDRRRAWNTWMSNQQLPASRACDTSDLNKIVALGKSLKIRGTPTIILANGERLKGAPSRMELEMAVASPKVIFFQESLKP